MKKVIVTVGPSLIDSSHLKTIDAENYIYRINGSQNSVEGIKEYIDTIRNHLPNADIALDLPGNKVRVANLTEPLKLKKGQRFTLSAQQTNYSGFYKHLKANDVVLAADSTLKFIIEDANEREIVFTSESDGELWPNRGLHVKGVYKDLPFLFQKDRELIEMANESRINYIGLSFVRNADDISATEGLIDSNITIISKIETKAAVDNLNEILKKVDYILIDRGDLSADIGLTKIPSYQKFIIDKAHFYNKKVFLSTQFLKSMEEKPVPTIAEVIDIYNTFKMGIYGIQLSEETSIGKYPRECLDVIKQVMEEIDSERR